MSSFERMAHGIHITKNDSWRSSYIAHDRQTDDRVNNNIITTLVLSFDVGLLLVAAVVKKQKLLRVGL
jgi:hypothetical protein